MISSLGAKGHGTTKSTGPPQASLKQGSKEKLVLSTKQCTQNFFTIA